MNYLMNPLISVIVPVYNVERYLNQSCLLYTSDAADD